MDTFVGTSVNRRVTKNKKKSLGVLQRRLVLSRLGLCFKKLLIVKPNLLFGTLEMYGEEYGEFAY